MSNINPPRQPKAVEVYLKTMEKITPGATPLGWWQKLNEEELMKTMQQFCWENSIDFNRVNWGKFIRGEHVPKSWE